MRQAGAAHRHDGATAAFAGGGSTKRKQIKQPDMKKRHSIHVLLAAAALLLATAACTKDELADGDRLPEGQYPLEIARITLGVEGGEAQPWGAPATRVSETVDGTGSVFDTGDLFAVQIDGKDETGIYTVQDDHTVKAETPCTGATPATTPSPPGTRHGRHPRPRRPKPKSCLPAVRHRQRQLPDSGHAEFHPRSGEGARHAFGRCTRRSAEPPALYLYTVYL